MMDSPEAINRLVGESWELMQSLSLSNLVIGTVYLYVKYLLAFLVWEDLTAETFYDKLNVWNSSRDRSANHIAMTVIKFQDHYIATNGCSYAVADNIYCAFKAFCRASKITLEYINRTPPDDQFEEEIPNMSMNQFRQIYDGCKSQKVRSMMTWSKDTMMRVSDISNLRFKDIQHLIKDPTQRFYTWKYKPLKTYKKTKPMTT